MVLERLQLTDFRGFESLELGFEPDLTVLVGINGCGKTSVIDALLIGLRYRNFSPQDVRVGAGSTTIRISSPGHPPFSITGELVGNGRSIGTVGSPDPWLPVLPLVYGVGRSARDETPGLTAPQEWKPARAKLVAPDKVDYHAFFRWFREMEDAENERIRYDDGSESPWLRAVRGAIHRLLPGYTNLRVRRSGAMGDLRPRLTLEKDGTLLLFDALSEGERSLIVMIADIARRLAIANPDAADPLAEPFLLIIDELEQHLHPQWQRTLPSRLREVFPGAQVLLTTHSPIVVSELLPRQLRALQGFRLIDGTHREGQDVNEILEVLFGTPSRRPKTQAMIDAIDDALDDDDLDAAANQLDVLEQQLGNEDPEVVRLRTLQRMLGARDHDAVSEE